MKKSQLKLLSSMFLIFTLLLIVVYAVGTTLLSPPDSFVDDDGYLDLQGKCEPKSENDYDGTTSWNITNATLYSNADGTWKSNATINVAPGLVNATYFFNFTNHINQTDGIGDVQWNILCQEQNFSNSAIFQTAFAGNRTLRVQYAQPTVESTSPINNFYDLDGDDIAVVCTGTSFGNWNISNVTLMTLSGSDWVGNQSHSPTLTADNAAEIVVNFTLGNYSDGIDITWACRFKQIMNVTGDSITITSFKSSANRTLNIEFPPNITLTSPPDNNWSRNRKVRINYTVSTEHGNGTTVSPFPSRIWTNETDGAWLPQTGSIQAINGTPIRQDYTFPEQTAILWGIQAFESNDVNVFNFSVNRTINIDTIAPTLVVSTASEAVFNGTVEIKFTVTDANLDTARVFTSLNGEAFAVNYTNISSTDLLVSGTEVTATFINIFDGRYNFTVFVNDSATTEVNSGNITIVVDRTAPGIFSLTNFSITGVCDQRNISFNTNETANHTIYIDTDTDTSDGQIFVSTAKILNHSIILDYNLTREVDHFINITSCDEAGNCVDRAQTTYTTPASVCAGWSQYAVYDAQINLSTIQNQSGADLVYFWNASAQDWVFLAAGLSANGAVTVGEATDYHVIHLFEDDNGTWYRNLTNPGLYRYNISTISNFIRIPRVYTFGNLTESFMNATVQFPSQISNLSDGGVPNGTTFGPFNISAMAGYNISNQDYVSHIFNFSFNNATFLEPCLGRAQVPTCMEVAWVASGFNISWNGTQIYTNWTKA